MFFGLFTSAKERRERKEKQIPIGSKWFFVGRDKSPWRNSDKGAFSITILDVKDGWVRYAHKALFTDERLEIDIFLSIYTPTEESTIEKE